MPKAAVKVWNATVGQHNTCECSVHCTFKTIKESYCRAFGVPPRCTEFYSYNKKISDEATPFDLSLSPGEVLEVVFSS